MAHEQSVVVVTATMTVSLLTRVTGVGMTLDEAVAIARSRPVVDPGEEFRALQLAHSDTSWVVTCDLSGEVQEPIIAEREDP